MERFLTTVAEKSISDSRECLLLNTALEVAPHETATGSVVTERLAKIQSFFRCCIEANLREGSISDDRVPQDLEHFRVARAQD